MLAVRKSHYVILCLIGFHWLFVPTCAQEAGMLAVRKNRYVILPKDFEKAYKNVVRKQARCGGRKRGREQGRAGRGGAAHGGGSGGMWRLFCGAHAAHCPFNRHAGSPHACSHPIPGCSRIALSSTSESGRRCAGAGRSEKIGLRRFPPPVHLHPCGPCTRLPCMPAPFVSQEHAPG